MLKIAFMGPHFRRNMAVQKMGGGGLGKCPPHFLHRHVAREMRTHKQFSALEGPYILKKLSPAGPEVGALPANIYKCGGNECKKYE